MRRTSKGKTYALEYRREAARLVIDTGRTATTVARDTGLASDCWAVLGVDRRRFYE